MLTMTPYAFLLALALYAATAPALEVKITPALESIQTLHQGRPITIQRNQDRNNRVTPFYSYTSRTCPPFCIQPMQAAPGVETYGELEVLDALARIGQGDGTLAVVDTRTAQWPKRGMIPGAINVPWTEFDLDTREEAITDILVPRFGVQTQDGKPDFSHAKTLILYCNGIWCSQSTNAIKALLDLGYPSDRIKWYRGGMQDWEILGLTTVKAP
jgi:rhodanese-related sulfurtransferase